jgi:hypothetical protein
VEQGQQAPPPTSYTLDIIDLPTSLSALDSEIPISVEIDSVDMTESLNLVARLETTGSTPTLVGEGVTLIEATSRTRRNAQSTATVTIVIPDSMLPLDMQASYSLKLFMAPAPSVSWDDRIAEAVTVSDMRAVSSVLITSNHTVFSPFLTQVPVTVAFSLNVSSATLYVVMERESDGASVGTATSVVSSSHGGAAATVAIDEVFLPLSPDDTYRITASASSTGLTTDVDDVVDGITVAYAVDVVDAPSQLESGATTISFTVRYAVGTWNTSVVLGVSLTREQGNIVVGMGDVQLASSTHGQVVTSVHVPNPGLQPVNADTTYRLLVFVYVPPARIIASEVLEFIPVTFSSQGSSTNTQSSGGLSRSDTTAAIASSVVLAVGIVVLVVVIVVRSRRQQQRHASDVLKNEPAPSATTGPYGEEFVWDNNAIIAGACTETPFSSFLLIPCIVQNSHPLVQNSQSRLLPRTVY